MYIFYHIFLISSTNEKYFRQKLWRVSTKTRFMCSNISSENRAIYEIMWKCTVQPGRPQMEIWRMRITCWIATARDTNSEYVILISFLLQQCLRARALILCHTYIACLVFSIVGHKVFY